MRKRILAAISSTLIIALSGASQSAELEVYTQHSRGGRLADNAQIAKGRIVCQETHSGFYVWMNAQKAGEQSGHYIIKGQTNSQHEIRVRLGGDGWLPSVIKDRNGVARSGTDERANFEILVDGNQNVAPDEYILSLRGVCL
ncbi:adhesin [Escherichia coli]|nr:adhesin [Escherichia coli]EFA7458023.1 adhesin [Escherichia coli]EFA7568826.1 adhesin [Escherichia coli]EFA7752287.1 adhesin [Escherichia coli]EFC1638012.1 adhesin [Escherichia coli]